MNYIKLKLGGKERGAKLGLGYLKFVTESRNVSLEELFKSVEGHNAALAVPELIYSSLSYNAKRSGEGFEFSEEDVFDWIDEDGGMNSPSLKIFIEAFTSSLGVNVGDEGKNTPPAKVAKK